VPPRHSTKGSPKRWELAGRIGLVATSLLVCLAGLEIVVRAWFGPLDDWSNLVLNARTVLANTQTAMYAHDDLLGYVPRPGHAGNNVNFDADGFRLNGGLDRLSAGGGTILAVGDSYTFGDEVADGETWPAYLQELSGRRVLNAGVAGYGLDQSVLRAEIEVAATHPSAIVVEFIADDMHRLEVRRLWGADKPYFEIVQGELVLRNVPVPPRPDPRRTLTWSQKLLGYSYLVDFILRRLHLLEDWFGDHIVVLPSGEGEKIACLLVERLARLQRTAGAPLLLVAQYDPYVWKSRDKEAQQRRMTNHVLDCARRQGLPVLDTFDAVAAWPGGPTSLYNAWHMNGAGNRLTASLILEALHGLGH
jgi:hypothetical protein